MSRVSLEPSFWQSLVWEHLPRTWALCSARNEEEFGFRHSVLVVKVNVSSKGGCYCQIETFTCHVSTTKCISEDSVCKCFRGFGLETEKFCCHPRAPLSAPPHPRICPHSSGIQKSKPSESQLLKWYSHFLHFLKFYWYEYSPSKTCIVLTVFGDLNALYLSASRRHLSCILFWQSLPFSCSSLFYSNSQVIGLATKFVQIFSWWNVYYPRLYSGPFLYNLFFSQQPE